MARHTHVLTPEVPHEGYLSRAVRTTGPFDVTFGLTIGDLHTRLEEARRQVKTARRGLKAAKKAVKAHDARLVQQAEARAEENRLRDLAISTLEDVALDHEDTYTGEARGDAAEQLIALTN